MRGSSDLTNRVFQTKNRGRNAVWHGFVDFLIDCNVIVGMNGGILMTRCT